MSIPVAYRVPEWKEIRNSYVPEVKAKRQRPGLAVVHLESSFGGFEA